MVKLRFRALQVSVQTPTGEFGAVVPFKPGLTVIRAENSSGKSTLVQSLIYALGLEAMLSARHDVPLPHAMTQNIEDEDTSVHDVLSSEVRLEMENHNGVIVTVVRQAKGERNHKLITLIHGPAISETTPAEPYPTEDKYVRDGGAATSQAGFHHWLASFLDWQLPEVATFDGKTCPLYVECMFPLFLVEQKKAWTGIQARMPTQFRIRDAQKRAIEFTLGFTVFDLLAKSQRLRDEKSDIMRQWQIKTAEASAIARGVGGALTGVTGDPMEKWGDKGLIELRLFRGKEWVSLADAMKQDESEIGRLQAQDIPLVSAVADDLSTQLRTAENDLETLHIAITEIAQDASGKRSQLVAIDARLDDLADSLAEHKSLQKMRRMGSKHAPKSVTDHRCPTCQQEMNESLLPQDQLGAIMSLDESIKYVETQKNIYQASRDNLHRVLVIADAELNALRNRETEQRSFIRSLRTSLVSEGHAPSRAAIEALQSAQARREQARRAESSIEEVFSELKALCVQWAKVTKELKLLPGDFFSQDDRAKLEELQKLFRDHATAFDVRSVPPSLIQLSHDNYKPEYQGLDLEFDLSASDLIRTIWAYLHSMLEVSRTNKTNHPGILVLDEPRQQETKPESFAHFFQRAQTAVDFGQQVIVATSQKMVELTPVLEGVRHKMIEFKTNHVLTRVAPSTDESADPASPDERMTTSNGVDTATESEGEEDDIPF